MLTGFEAGCLTGVSVTALLAKVVLLWVLYHHGKQAKRLKELEDKQLQDNYSKYGKGSTRTMWG